MEMYSNVLFAIVGTLLAILFALFIIYGIITVAKQIIGELSGKKPDDDDRLLR